MKFLNMQHGMAFILILFLGVARAEDPKPVKKSAASTGASSNAANSAGAKDKRKQTIDFEDELIQGDVNKPELFYLLQKKQFNFKRLIKLREDFLPEMRRTSEEVQRNGSKN